MTRFTRRQFVGKTGATLGAVAVAPTVLAACGSDDDDSSASNSSGGGGDDGAVFKVGAVLELSGADSTGGQIARRGYKLWADTVNDQGGIDIGGTRHKVELIVQDCQSQPSTAATAVTRLANEEKVDAMFGSYTSGVQIAMNPLCEKYKLPVIAGSAESPNNWKPQPKWAYGIIPPVDASSRSAIELLVEIADPKPKSIAALGIREPFSSDTADGFRDGGKAAGLTVSHYSLFPLNADMAPIAGVVKGKNPDIVAVGGHDTALVDFVKALYGANFVPKAIIEHYGVTDSSFAKALGKRADGVLGIAVWLPDMERDDDFFGSSQEFVASYKKKYGVEPDYTAAGCAASGIVLAEALKKLGSGPNLSDADRAKLNDLIAETDMETFYGKIKFEQSGSSFHANTAIDPILIQIQDGKSVAIAPEVAKKGDLIYPLQKA